MRLSVDALRKCEVHFVCLNECLGQIRSFTTNEFENLSNAKTLKSETLRVLATYQADRCLGVYCLLVNGLIWDAEIVLRSVYEAFSKIMLISLAEPDDSERLLSEFWTDLSAIYDRKGALKAETAESLAREFSPEDTRIFETFRDSRLFDVEPRGNKTSRKEIEQRWSFAGIVETIAKCRFGKFASIEALAHQYGIASHLSHVSPKAFDLLEDRATRGTDRLALEIGHACRVCSDIVSLLSFSAHFATSNDPAAREMSPELRFPFERMSRCIEKDRQSFHESQDDFYRSRS